MPIYTCTRCGYESAQKIDLKRHCERKKPCPCSLTNNQATFIVKGSLETFASRDSRIKELESSNQANTRRIAELESLLRQRDKPRRKSLNAALRMGLWNSEFGEKNANGQCYCCTREVTQQNFEAGHIISVANNGPDHLSNLRVVCRKCNLSMGTQDMNVFRQTHFQ